MQADLGSLADRAGVGADRLHAGLRRLPARRGAGGGPGRAAARFRGRARAVRRGLAGVRARPRTGAAAARRPRRRRGWAPRSSRRRRSRSHRRPAGRPGAGPRAGLVDRGGRGRRGRRLGAGRRCSPAWLGWRWVFLVNVPVCPLWSLLARRALPSAGPPRPAARRARRSARHAGLGGAGARRVTLVGLERRRPVALLAALGTAVLAAGRRAPRGAARRGPLLDGRCCAAPAWRAERGRRAADRRSVTADVLCTLHAQQVLGLSPAAAGLLFPPFNAAVIAGSFLGPRVVAASRGTPCDGRRPPRHGAGRGVPAGHLPHRPGVGLHGRRDGAGRGRSGGRVGGVDRDGTAAPKPPARASRPACSRRAPSSAPRSGSPP